MEVCVRHEVPIIITSLRPPEEIVTAVHEYGGVVFHDVISMRHAQKAIEQGVDGVMRMLRARLEAMPELRLSVTRLVRDTQAERVTLHWEGRYAVRRKRLLRTDAVSWVQVAGRSAVTLAADGLVEEVVEAAV